MRSVKTALEQVLFLHEDDQAGSPAKALSYVEMVVFKPAFHEDPVGYIHDVFTAPEARGKGMAAELVAEAKKYAKEKGCYKVFLVCKPPLVGWYGRNRFQKTGVHMQAVLRRRRRR